MLTSKPASSSAVLSGAISVTAAKRGRQQACVPIYVEDAHQRELAA